MCAMAAADGTAGGGIAGKAGKAGIVCSPVKKETSDDAPANMSGASPNGMAALGEAANGIGAGGTALPGSTSSPASASSAAMANHQPPPRPRREGGEKMNEKKRNQELLGVSRSSIWGFGEVRHYQYKDG